MRPRYLLIAGATIAALAAFRSGDRAPDAPGDTVPVAAVVPPLVPTGWRRPPGPPRVALQAGHWKAAEAPEEQARLRANGTRGGGKAEWEVNLGIARRTAELLETRGYAVDVLPTTIPPGYWADLFIAIHADGNPSAAASGYRAAAPRRDATCLAGAFASLLERAYGDATGLPRYPTVTRRMLGYYAFNYRRYRHARARDLRLVE